MDQHKSMDHISIIIGLDHYEAFHNVKTHIRPLWSLCADVTAMHKLLRICMEENLTPK